MGEQMVSMFVVTEQQNISGECKKYLLCFVPFICTSKEPPTLNDLSTLIVNMLC